MNMTATQLATPANLPHCCWDVLAALWGHFDAKAIAATSPSARGRFRAARERVGDEVSRRGLVIRSNRYGNIDMPASEVRYMVGRPEHFQPIR